MEGIGRVVLRALEADGCTVPFLFLRDDRIYILNEIQKEECQ